MMTLIKMPSTEESLFKLPNGKSGSDASVCLMWWTLEQAYALFLFHLAPANFGSDWRSLSCGGGDKVRREEVFSLLLLLSCVVGRCYYYSSFFILANFFLRGRNGGLPSSTVGRSDLVPLLRRELARTYVETVNEVEMYSPSPKYSNFSCRSVSHN